MPAPRRGWRGRKKAADGTEPAPKPAKAHPNLEDLFYAQLGTLSDIPLPQRQVRFHPVRRYKLDFGWPDLKLGIEIEGGIWNYSASHTSASGIKRDIDKHNLAIQSGWTVVRADSTMVKSGDALALIADLYRSRTGIDNSEQL